MNKSTKSIRELASNFSAGAIGVLVKIAGDPAAPHASRVMACRELLDRAHGRPSASAEIKLPAGSPAEQAQAVIKAGATGKLPLDHMTALVTALSAQAKLIEQAEITQRLEDRKSVV